VNPLFGFFEGALSPTHVLIVLIVGMLLFGKRLPEIGRSLGKGIVEFKKGMKGLEDEIDSAVTPRHETPAPQQIRPPQRVVTQVPRFDDHSTNVTPPPPEA